MLQAKAAYLDHTVIIQAHFFGWRIVKQLSRQCCNANKSYENLACLPCRPTTVPTHPRQLMLNTKPYLEKILMLLTARQNHKPQQALALTILGRHSLAPAMKAHRLTAQAGSVCL